MMSALQRIVLVAAILAIMTAVTVESAVTCYQDDQCRKKLGIVSCMVQDLASYVRCINN